MVKSSKGHVLDLPKARLGVDLNNNFEPKYIPISGKKEVIKELQAVAKGTKEVLLAPDPDREGEAIAWHLQSLLGLPPQVPCRVEFNEITKRAVIQALASPRLINQDRVGAQQARRVLDRLVGYSLSPLLWRKMKKKSLSAGRVQSVAVRLICEREEEIQKFIPEEYWSLTAFLCQEGFPPFPAKLVAKKGEKLRLTSRAEVEAILKELEGASYKVQKIKKQTKHQPPYPPFITSTLQQSSSRRLNFTAPRTMRIAQQLYEGLELGKEEGAVGLITYLRTDAVWVAGEAQAEAREYLTARYGPDYLPPAPPQYRSRAQAQEAHEAIRPTSIWREPEALKKALTPDQYRLYKLIWERFLASQMPAAVLEVTTAEIAAGDYLFRASGSVVKFPGFRRVYKEEEEAGEEGSLPPLTEGVVLLFCGLEPKQHFTQPSPRYTEASLINALEEKGIGRPSTYAPIIETILKRGYVVRKEKQFFPTELGFTVVELLKAYFAEIINVEFTAQMEAQLDLVAMGNLYWREVVAQFYYPFAAVLERADREIGVVKVEEEISTEKCTACGVNLVVKNGKYGKFLACPNFPQCHVTRPYLEKIGVACPLCGSEVVERRTKKGRRFYGCSRYPECGFFSWEKPTNETCSFCGGYLVEKKGKKVCGSKTCPGAKGL